MDQNEDLVLKFGPAPSSHVDEGVSKNQILEEYEGDENNENVLRQRLVLVNPLKLSRDREEIIPIVVFILGVLFLGTIPAVPGTLGMIVFRKYKSSKNDLSRAFAQLNFGLSIIGQVLSIIFILSYCTIVLNLLIEVAFIGVYSVPILIVVCIGLCAFIPVMFWILVSICCCACPGCCEC